MLEREHRLRFLTGVFFAATAFAVTATRRRPRRAPQDTPAVLVNHELARLALEGALPSAVAMIVATCWTLIRPHWQSHHHLFIVLVSVGAFMLASVRDLPPLWVLGLSAVVARWSDREDA